MNKNVNTDPLAAAYMAREFGMEFDIPNDKYGKAKDYSITYACEEFGVKPPFYIHPDSLPILQPQDGDVYLNTAGRPEIWHERQFLNGRWVKMTWHKDYKIIQRNNKPFFAPLEEADQ